MATRKLTPEEVQAITRLAKQWGKIVVRHAFGDQGPGLDVDLTQMEEVAYAAAQGLTAGALEEATSQQRQQLGEHQSCPTCGKLCTVTTEERLIHVKGGGFQLREPKCYCPTCRRDFFPSASVLKLNANGYSPTIMYKIMSATAEVKSHDKAATLLKVLCELPISGRHVNRLAEEIGQEMAAQRDQVTEDYVHHRRQVAARARSGNGGHWLGRRPRADAHARPRNGGAWSGVEGRQGGLPVDIEGSDVHGRSASAAAAVLFGCTEGGQDGAGNSSQSRRAPRERVAAVGRIAFRQASAVTATSGCNGG